MKKKSLFGYDLTEIKNINEELVVELMDKLLNDDDSICRCQLCIEDIFALSLNKLPTLYVQSTFKENTFRGYDLTKILDREKVEKAVRTAANKVSKNPYH
jgi:competence protein ComFB